MLMEVYVGPLMETPVFRNFLEMWWVGGSVLTKGNSSKCPFATTIWSLWALCSFHTFNEYCDIPYVT